MSHWINLCLFTFTYFLLHTTQVEELYYCNCIQFKLTSYCLFQAGTPNPTVTVWLRDLKNDSLSNVTLLQKPQALHTERWDVFSKVEN